MKKIMSVLVLTLVYVSAVCQTVEQEVTVVGKDGVKLSGSLLLPSVDQEGEVPVAIIVAGSGPTDRNGNNVMMLNNSLKMLAEGLAACGIASIRYDKRGIGASVIFDLDESKMVLEDFSSDVSSWVEFARKDGRLGDVTVIGHSEGAKLALMSSDSGADIDRVILLAGPGRPMDLILKEQLASQPAQVRDCAYAIIDSLSRGVTGVSVPVYLNALFRPSVQPFMVSDMAVDPAELASRVNVPMLIVQGDTDIQITLRDAVALSAANHDAELLVIHDMNHILKECDSKDRGIQTQIYSNPSLPLHKELVGAVSEFILN